METLEGMIFLGSEMCFCKSYECFNAYGASPAVEHGALSMRRQHLLQCVCARNNEEAAQLNRLNIVVWTSSRFVPLRSQRVYKCWDTITGPVNVRYLVTYFYVDFLFLVFDFLRYWIRIKLEKEQEVLWRTNRLLSWIRHGPHRKWRVQQFFYCCVCIRYRSNVSTEQLSIKDKGDTHTHRQQRGHMSQLYFFKIRKVGWNIE
jgi:hypothetical protein